MNNEMLGFKEIYNCIIKATYDIDVGDKKIYAGEPILTFEKIQVANFQEIKARADATGGFQNSPVVSWEETKKVLVSFSQGVFSQLHLAILGNSHISEVNNLEVPKEEFKVEVNEDGKVTLKEIPSGRVYIYACSDGKRIEYTQEGKVLTLMGATPFEYVNIYYDFLTVAATVINIGRQLLNGYLTLQAKTRLKDDKGGKIVTGIFKIPKMKLMSDFSIRLGEVGPPSIGNFQVDALPTGSKGNEKTIDFIVLDRDIDSDID